MCRKGISSSALPYKRTPPSWLKISSQDVSCRCYFKVFCLRFDDFCMWFCLLGDATNVTPEQCGKLTFPISLKQVSVQHLECVKLPDQRKMLDFLIVSNC